MNMIANKPLALGAVHARDFGNDRGHDPLLQADSSIAERTITPYVESLNSDIF